jgi:hypothetical protein
MAGVFCSARWQFFTRILAALNLAGHSRQS